MAQPGPVPGPAPGPGPVAAPASSCPDIEVIFARGTDDTPGLGTPGTAFVNALRPLVGGRTLTAYAVNYPASYDFLAAADGAYDATNRITMMSQQCPRQSSCSAGTHRALRSWTCCSRARAVSPG